MISNPDAFAARYAKAGADYVIIHVEASEHPRRTFEAIRKAGGKPGISVSPGTPAEAIRGFLPDVDMALVMTVRPGFGGQSFMTEQLRAREGDQAMERGAGPRACTSRWTAASSRTRRGSRSMPAPTSWSSAPTSMAATTTARRSRPCGATSLEPRIRGGGGSLATDITAHYGRGDLWAGCVQPCWTTASIRTIRRSRRSPPTITFTAAAWRRRRSLPMAADDRRGRPHPRHRQRHRRSGALHRAAFRRPDHRRRSDGGVLRGRAPAHRSMRPRRPGRLQAGRRARDAVRRCELRWRLLDERLDEHRKQGGVLRRDPPRAAPGRLAGAVRDRAGAGRPARLSDALGAHRGVRASSRPRRRPAKASRPRASPSRACARPPSSPWPTAPARAPWSSAARSRRTAPSC